MAEIKGRTHHRATIDDKVVYFPRRQAIKTLITPMGERPPGLHPNSAALYCLDRALFTSSRRRPAAYSANTIMSHKLCSLRRSDSPRLSQKLVSAKPGTFYLELLSIQLTQAITHNLPETLSEGPRTRAAHDLCGRTRILQRRAKRCRHLARSTLARTGSCSGQTRPLWQAGSRSRSD